jgi:hypothetical protein
MNIDRKKDYIKLFNSLDIDSDFKEAVIGFIETYDGTQEDRFYLLLSQVILLITERNNLLIKATCFDELSENLKDFEDSTQAIKEAYTKIQSGTAVSDDAVDSDESEE